MFFLYRAERISCAILCLLALSLSILQALGGTRIFWPAFLGGLTLFGLIVMIGLGLRVLGVLPRLSQTLFALGLLPIYSTFLALIGYMFFPLNRPLVDDLLFAADASLGYDWAVLVKWLAAHPDFSALLRLIYLSSFYQLALLLIYLGLTGRRQALHAMVVTLMVSGILVTAFWAVWPSFGPAAYIDIPADVAAASQLLVTPEYGAHLMRLAQDGMDAVGEHMILGAVAFPSFHIVMAMIAVWFARGTWLVWPYTAANMLMIPATLGHGGHHLTDLVGGVVLFVFAFMLMKHLLSGTHAAFEPTLGNMGANSATGV